MLFEYGVIVGAFAIIASAFVYLARSEADAAVRFWLAGWCSVVLVVTAYNLIGLFESGAIKNLLLGASFSLETAIPLLLLAGCIAYVRKRIPRWLLPTSVALCTLRGGLAMADQQEAALHLVYPVEVIADLASAILIFRFLPNVGLRIAPVALGSAYIIAGVYEGTEAYLRLIGAPMLEAHLVGCSIAGAQVLAQILAIHSRTREREEVAQRSREADLDLLRRIANQGVLHRDSKSLSAAVLEMLRNRLELDSGGLWLFEEGEQSLACVHSFGLPPNAEQLLGSIPASYPDVRALLSTHEPYISQDVGRNERFAESFGLREAIGVQSAALVPLWWRGTRLGFLFAGLETPRTFSATDRKLLVAVVGELSLAIQNVQAVEHLNRERLTLRSILEASPVGVIVEDRNGRITMFSEQAALQLTRGDPAEWLGRCADEFLESLTHQLAGSETLTTLRQARGSHRVESIEICLRWPEQRTLVVTTGPVESPNTDDLGRIWVTHDITERQRLASELEQARKLETIGRLAGGIAHDFNNQLTVILGNGRFLESYVTSDEPHEALSDVLYAAEHCAQLTRSLLAFARRSPVEPIPLDVESLLNEVINLLRPLIPSSIRIRSSVSLPISRVAADPAQLQQVLVNLAINARDAILDRGKEEEGEIRIEARNQRVDAPYDEFAPGGTGQTEENLVEFRVSDTGAGMDPETLSRVFEPFFTTKATGEGTGLGLSIVHGAIESHGGTVSVDSTPGKGTVFTLLLPAASTEFSAAGDEARTGPRRGSETVLIADDEPGVRRLALRVLVRHGYSVLEASDGLEASAIFAENADSIDMVVLDMTMPGQTGAATLRDIRKRSAKTPVLVVSGLSTIGDLGETDAHVEFLQKPFGSDVLGERVRSMLDAP